MLEKVHVWLISKNNFHPAENQPLAWIIYTLYILEVDKKKSETCLGKSGGTGFRTPIFVFEPRVLLFTLKIKKSYKTSINRSEKLLEQVILYWQINGGKVSLYIDWNFSFRNLFFRLPCQKTSATMHFFVSCKFENGTVSSTLIAFSNLIYLLLLPPFWSFANDLSSCNNMFQLLFSHNLPKKWCWTLCYCLYYPPLLPSCLEDFSFWNTCPLDFQPLCHEPLFRGHSLVLVCCHQCPGFTAVQNRLDTTSEYSKSCAHCQFRIRMNANVLLEGFSFNNSDQFFSLAPSIFSYGWTQLPQSINLF